MGGARGMSDHRRDAAISLLGRMLAGLSSTAPQSVGDEPDISMSTIREIGETGLFARITTHTGDVFRVVVDWVPEESP